MPPSLKELQLTTTLMTGCAAECGIWRHFLDRLNMCYRRVVRVSIPHPVKLDPLTTQSQTIKLPSTIVRQAAFMQCTHDATMLKQTQGLCRTKPIDLSTVSSLLATVPLDIAPTQELTAGGMSRIFATERPDILIKVSDVSRGWSKFEKAGYDLLQRHDIPTAALLYAGFRDGYLIIVVERLSFTVSTMIRSIAQSNVMYLDEVVRGLQSLLANLRQAHITFSDLSPDNIACRRVDGDAEGHEKIELVLIDPQFAVPTASLAAYMGSQRAEEFDTVHLSLKIMAMGAVSKNATIKLSTDAVCCAILGMEDLPSRKAMTMWLLKVLPIALRLAYKALERSEDESVET